ncbi:zinc-dependent metalloprotease [Cellulomonas fimi]|uniref:Coenzyme F420 biosynthesis-associated protein n=1 Tax=Cellulomonas fimi TaxID=1708 RepID=A0A7Y0LYS8_CELFI|nr:zinc-dependent metalloprotease [Cellulomonas fimi]NMR20359.1 hypothetical protein [Cellulomonas fimi]
MNAHASAVPVDWPTAARFAHSLVRPGPSAERAELTTLVGDLRAAATTAAGHVVRITGMTPADGAHPDHVPLSRVLVVDRSRWARANTELLASMTADLSPEPGEKGPSRATRFAGSAQAGGVLALLSAKVLGQFDPFTPRAVPGGALRGRLLLVAPNVLQVERELGVAPADFRLWVALHEQTHALQFAAAPWLADHLRARAGVLLGDLTRDDEVHERERLRALVTGAARTLRGDDDAPGVAAMLTADERRVFEEVGAVMALLEGHADVSMDAVGRSVVPTVRRIRARFEERRSRAGRQGPVNRLLRQVLGLDLKLAQYREGAAFVRAVTRDIGQEGFNAVWAQPAHLPSAREIADPRAWVRRVHG